VGAKITLQGREKAAHLLATQFLCDALNGAIQQFVLRALDSAFADGAGGCHGQAQVFTHQPMSKNTPATNGGAENALHMATPKVSFVFSPSRIGRNIRAINISP
jgi:hypothetical protein